MITKKALMKRAKDESINVNIISFEVTEEYVWFAFSFDEQHKTRAHAIGLDPHTEDDAYIDWLNDDDNECYKEAINQIKFSRLNPNLQLENE